MTEQIPPEPAAGRAPQPVELPDVPRPAQPKDVVFDCNAVSVHYGPSLAIREVTVDLHKQEITAFIGPSGCGKSTLIRCLNRLNDLVEGVRIEGDVLFEGDSIFDPRLDVIPADPTKDQPLYR